MKKIFVICPVKKKKRQIFTKFIIWTMKKLFHFEEEYEKVQKKIRTHIRKLKNRGYKVHWPPRDTDQSDPIGNKICKTNLTAIFEADEIHIWYDENSKGSLFDFGAVFMLIDVCDHKKKFMLINRDAKATPRKSFINVIRYLEKKTAHL